MRNLALLAVMALVVGASAQVSIPMDQQVNLGLPGTDQSPNGDAIYAGFSSGTVSFESDATGGFTRFHKNGGGWYYMYVDLNLAGIGEIDITGQTLSIDARAFDDPNTNTNPFGDTNFFLRVYTYGDLDGDGIYTDYVGNRDYGIVYGPNASSFPFGDWSNWNTVVVDLSNAPHTDGDAFDPTRVSRIRFYGTNWSGTGDDYGDFRNLYITPEPASLLVLVLGTLLRRR